MISSFQRHDISDKDWALLEPYLPGRPGLWGGVAHDNRRFLNAVFWILRTGAPWRDLPPGYGDWKNVHRRFCRWRNNGVWESLLERLIEEPGYEWLIINALKNHQDVCRTSLTPRYLWPWMRLICRSELLLQRLPRRIEGNGGSHCGNDGETSNLQQGSQQQHRSRPDETLKRDSEDSAVPEPPITVQLQ
jgi:transposase